MVKLSNTILNKLLKELQSSLEVEFKDNFTGLVLFGSYARNEANNHSDLDLIITFKKLPSSRVKRMELLTDFLLEFENKYELEINAIISDENKISKTYLVLDIAEYAKIIIDKNNKITNLFNSIKKDYDVGLVKKIPTGDHYMLWASDLIV